MCRMYGVIADRPVQVGGDLVDSSNCLLVQSRGRPGCGPHGDGWGIGYHAGARPRVVRGIGAAFDDGAFADAAASVTAAAIVAHVRQASVGELSEANTHPFTHGPWLFAHNGTVTAIEQVGPLLERETPAPLLSLRQGSTDSELAFLWLLSRLNQAGIAVDEPCRQPEKLARHVAEAVRALAALCHRHHPEEPPRLNFLLTDGSTLVATRWNHTLHWRVWPLGSEGHAAAVASEPIGDATWSEVPNETILWASPSLIGAQARMTKIE